MGDQSQVHASSAFTPADFFVLRTPLLPFDELLAWSDGLTARVAVEGEAARETRERTWRSDIDLLRARLRVIVERPEIVHALFVASPSLVSALDHWKRDPDSKKGLKVERALVRYFARMCGRATPFGLFSGCSVGEISTDGSTATPTLRLQRRETYQTFSRLDFDYLFSLTTALRRDTSVAMELSYWPNTSVHVVADVCHYIESRLSNTRRTHHLVKVHRDEYVDAVLVRSREGATVPELIDAVLAVGQADDVSPEEARDYVKELIDSELLVSSLSPLVTGPQPLDDLITQFERLSSAREPAHALKRVRDGLADLDRQRLGVAPAAYDDIARVLEQLPAKVETAHLYQVDMMKPAEALVLTKGAIDELIVGVDVVRRLGEAMEPGDLQKFREAFSVRYERARVPLLEALDEEIGVGFGAAAAESSPLIRGLRLDGGKLANGRGGAEVQPFLLEKLTDCIRQGKSELLLNASDLPSNRTGAPSLPDAIVVNGTLIASSFADVQKGNFEIRWRGAVGPNGAQLFGRFCHADADLERRVRHFLKEEEAFDPQAIYAEIVYLPEGRVGNVLCRPVLRDYEIVHLGRSGAVRDRQIPTSDLVVALEGNQIVLYSRRLQRRVIPRLTNAHNFKQPQLAPVYRFLCALQHQHGISGQDFWWGGLDALSYLPRVRVGRLVLSAARWRLAADEISRLRTARGHERFAAVQDLARRLGLPRWILMEEGDNHLPVDLHNALSVDAFVQALNPGAPKTVREMYPTPDELCATGPEGRYCHELNVPLIRRAPRPSSTNTMRTVESHPIPRAGRRHGPGSDWLYVKVYCGASLRDDVLTTSMPDLVERASHCGAARWFFVQYADPHEHVRIRFNGPSGRLMRDVMPLITETLNPLLAAGKVWKIQFDTYEREVERYGGLEGLSAAEDIFFADSEAVLTILRELNGDEGLDLRWRIALLGTDLLLSDCGFDAAGKRLVMKGLCESYYAEFDVRSPARKELGDRFRIERRRIQSLFQPANDQEPAMAIAREAFARRSVRVTIAVEKLNTLARNGHLAGDLSTLACSYVHMHVNRMIRSATRKHELMLYDFLSRVYDGEAARDAKGLATPREFLLK
jgi:lantibiotic biosynthesis protein